MGFLSLIVRSYVSCILHHRDWKHTDMYKGFNMYRSYKRDRANRGNYKNLINVYLEVNRLSNYWHCFPEVYFRFAMFVKGYGDMTKMKSFIPQSAYARYAKDSDPSYHVLIDDKIIFYNLMQYYHIPVPERLFVYQYGLFVGIDNNGPLTDSEVDEMLNTNNDTLLFIKKYRGGAGSGISVAIRKVDGYYLSDGERLSASVIRERFNDSNYIFERQIIQDEQLSRYNPDTVNTIRVLTYKNSIISASVRFGGRGQFVDNASKGGVAISLDITSGRLGEYGQRMYDAKKYFEHPCTHVKFTNDVLKQWPQIQSLVQRSLVVLPYYNSVGFDIATTRKGPVIVEINTGAGVGLSQMGKEFGIADCFIKDDN